jgi:hypothetical protein
MATVRVDTHIAASAERVWSILADFAAYREWNPFVRSLEGELREGASLRAEMAIVGRVLPADVELSRVAPNRELAWTGGFTPRFLLHAVHAFRLEPGADGVRLVHEETIGGVLSPLMMLWMGGDLRRQFERSNEALKRRAEGGGDGEPVR